MELNDHVLIIVMEMELNNRVLIIPQIVKHLPTSR